MSLLIAATVFWTLATAAPAPAPAPSSTPTQQASQSAVYPKFASATWIANLTDPAVSRDSCGSALFGDRVLWTCRDTEPFVDGKASLPLITNTASWTDLLPSSEGGGPNITTNGPVGAGSDGTNPILLMYGGEPTSLPAFFPVLGNECPSSGVCTDGSRYAIWPDQPALVTQDDSANGGAILGYTWIPQANLVNLTALVPNPAYTLYQTSYTPSANTDDGSTLLPSVTVSAAEFYAEGEIGYGNYGSLIVNGTAYLYGSLADGLGRALARVPVGQITDSSAYEYLVDEDWTSTKPAMTNAGAAVPNAGTGGQGTFFWSGYFNSFVWIGQAGISVSADFYISTAPSPEGPWVEAYLLYSAPNGDDPMGAYSLQANPALLPSGLAATEDYVYLTYTMQFLAETYGAYVTPLVKLTFEGIGGV